MIILIESFAKLEKKNLKIYETVVELAAPHSFHVLLIGMRPDFAKWCQRLIYSK